MQPGDKIRNIAPVEVGEPPVITIAPGTAGVIDWTSAITVDLTAAGVRFTTEPYTIITVDFEKLELA